MKIRAVQPADLEAITAIYAYHVLHGTGTFEEDPPSLEEMRERVQRVTAAGNAWLVATGESGVLGFAYFAQYRDRSAYRFTAEDSVYVRNDVRGQGVGKALAAALVDAAARRGYRQMIAVIGDSENVGSIGLHLSVGFRQVGILRAVGFKFGRWLDVVLMQRPLGEADRSLPNS
ncbi:MAG: GNAT family N-acetyltransferase [Rhodovarius sp.]|nr:GNAT family N-acetyltransferase [Rhodovarius sp.]